VKSAPMLAMPVVDEALAQVLSSVLDALREGRD